MKKLNRKGFTLVELLAVIVILAIVVGIAIPSVTSIINNSKKNGFETAMESAAGYLTKQAQLMNVDAGSIDKEFSDMGFVAGTAKPITYSATDAKIVALWKKLGLNSNNVNKLTIKYNVNGTACLTVNSIPTSSQYFTVADWKADGSAPASGSKIKTAFGAGC